MRLAHLPFIAAALAVASTAAAHSWQLSSVVGTIDPATVRCDDHGCTATLRAERVQLQYDRFDRREDAVELTVPTRAVLGGRGETWADPRAALLALGDAPVRARGELDWLGDRGALTVERLARIGKGAVDPRALPTLFPSCGRPPWSQDVLRSCFSVAGRERAITVHATLATDADAEAPLRGNSGIAWLDLDEVRIDEMGIALGAPMDHEAAVVRAVKKLGHPTAARSSLKTLRAGDRLTLEAAYVLPAPAGAKGIEGPQCVTERCWPELAVESVAVDARR
jgi:hypothetical protein